MNDDSISRLGQSISNIVSAMEYMKKTSADCACLLSGFEERYRRNLEKALLYGDMSPRMTADPLHPTFFNRTGFWKSVSYMGIPQ